MVSSPVFSISLQIPMSRSVRSSLENKAPLSLYHLLSTVISPFFFNNKQKMSMLGFKQYAGPPPVSCQDALPASESYCAWTCQATISSTRAAEVAVEGRAYTLLPHALCDYVKLCTHAQRVFYKQAFPALHTLTHDFSFPVDCLNPPFCPSINKFPRPFVVYCGSF